MIFLKQSIPQNMPRRIFKLQQQKQILILSWTHSTACLISQKRKERKKKKITLIRKTQASGFKTEHFLTGTDKISNLSQHKQSFPALLGAIPSICQVLTSPLLHVQ